MEEPHETLLTQLYNLLTPNWVSNLANASALLFDYFHHQNLPQSKVNWAGFYLLNNDKTKLVLGPFQGKIACQEIKVGTGVCGKAVEQKQPQLVADVHAFKGHIACDESTNSEIVVPIFNLSGEILGVLDIDCKEKNAFSTKDIEWLEKVCLLLAPSLENHHQPETN